jgi:hypothetical protein
MARVVTDRVLNPSSWYTGANRDKMLGRGDAPGIFPREKWRVLARKLDVWA